MVNVGCGVKPDLMFPSDLVVLKWPPEEDGDDSRIASCSVEWKQLFLSLTFSF